MENIFTISKPFLVFAKALGIFPMTFEEPARKGKLKVKLFDIVLSVLSLLAISYITLSSFSSKIFFSGDRKIMETAWYILKNLDVTSYFFLFWYQIVKRKSILNFVLLLADLDEKVRPFEIFDIFCL